MPGNFQLLCLLDLTYGGNKGQTCLCTKCGGEQAKDFQPEVCDAWETEGTQENVFLIPITPIRVSKMEIDGGYLCIQPRGNKISLRLEGLGDRTKVSEWQIQ
jgi:hypothetical protein